MTLSKRDQVLSVIRKIQLEALEEIDRICRKYDIKYNLGGGTCLGAVRHGGYIPWDDDIDIDMDRAEFEKFIDACDRELDTEKYTLQCHEKDPEFYSFTPRLMINNTTLNNKSMEMSGNDHCIFIDIFMHDFIPNDPVKRQEYLDKIYMTKVLTYFKWYGTTAHIAPEKQAEARKFVDSKDYDYFMDEFDKYAKHYHNRGEKTDYIIDTAIINGNYGGFPYSIKDDYLDVKFEGLTVKILKDYDTYLSILYGKNYMEIFPKEKRTSHHKWKRVELGPYAEKYGLEPGDEKYIIMNLDSERLRKVKKVSLDMLDVIDEICRKHNITYYVSGMDALYKANSTEEYAKLWRDDITVLMEREGLEKFKEVAPSELTHFYFLEHDGTTEDYHFPYAKLKLNYTYFRDRRTFPADVNQGLWINIGLLVPTSNDATERQKHHDELEDVYSLIRMKWLYSDVRAEKFFEREDGGQELYSKWEEAQKYTLEELIQRQNELLSMYEGKRFTRYLIEATTSLLNVTGMPKNALKKGKRQSYLGHEYSFPANLKKYSQTVCEENGNYRVHLAQVLKMKEKNPKKYEDRCFNLTEKQEEKMNRKVSLFELGMYDADDYRSGVFDMDIEPLDGPIIAD